MAPESDVVLEVPLVYLLDQKISQMYICWLLLICQTSL